MAAGVRARREACGGALAAGIDFGARKRGRPDGDGAVPATLLRAAVSLNASVTWLSATQVAAMEATADAANSETPVSETLGTMWTSVALCTQNSSPIMITKT